MTNAPADQSPSPQPAAVQIGMGAQYIKDFSFENPHAPQIFNDLNQQPQISMDVNVMSRGMGDNAYESVLSIRLESQLANRTAFILSLIHI